jgi:glycerate 2-kinase
MVSRRQATASSSWRALPAPGGALQGRIGDPKVLVNNDCWEGPLDRETTLLRNLFAAALRAADPMQVLPAALPAKPAGRCVVVGAGKAAARMAQAVEAAWPDVPLTGVVVTRYGHSAPTQHLEVLEAGHPVPDLRSESAARRILAAVQGLTTQDLVLALLSGGGSATMALPCPGLTLSQKAAIANSLLRSGATIAEFNTVRRHFSAIKGGHLAAATAPARLVTLAISDVPGDEPATIASGPTVANPTTRGDAEAILRRYNIPIPTDAKPLPPPRPPPTGTYRLIASPAMALLAAADAARAGGVTPLILGDALEGEAREAGRVLAGVALSSKRHGNPARPPAILLSSGETTVTLGREGAGRGGRNTEFLLALALQLNGAAGIHALAADTDGIDGTESAAGAVISPATLAKASAAGLDAAAMLRTHDSYSLFAAVGALVVTGPTLTNVNDFRAILIT